MRRQIAARGRPGSGRDVLRGVRALLLRARVRWSALPVGLVVVYHLLDDDTGDPSEQLVAPHAVALFEAHLATLTRHYRCVRASELGDAVAARRRGGRPPVAVTFDDDSRSHLDRAAPALATAGVQATFFLTGAALGEPSAYWWEDLVTLWSRGEAGFVTAAAGPAAVGEDDRGAPGLRAVASVVERLPAAERDDVARRLRARVASPRVPLAPHGIRALADAGHEIGFHTRRHHWMTRLEPEELERALEEGRADLAAVAGAPLGVIAYPHGRADAVVARRARAHGFLAGFTTVARRHRAGDDELLIGRYWPTYGSPAHFALEVAQLLAGRWGPERPE